MQTKTPKRRYIISYHNIIYWYYMFVKTWFDISGLIVCQVRKYLCMSILNTTLICPCMIGIVTWWKVTLNNRGTNNHSNPTRDFKNTNWQISFHFVDCRKLFVTYMMGVAYLAGDGYTHLHGLDFSQIYLCTLDFMILCCPISEFVLF